MVESVEGGNEVQVENEVQEVEEEKVAQSGVYTRDHYAKAEFWDDRFKE
jgi:hypothetical protein